jgi:hypothetical protein
MQTKTRNNFATQSLGPIVRVLTASVFLGILLSLTGCRGYHLGNQYMFRSDIRSVHVAIIESNSNRRFLGQRITEAITREVMLNTPLTITEPELADSFITGRLVRDRKNVMGETISDEPRTLQVAWRVEISWTDRAGVPLMQKQSAVINYDTDFIPEGGQSMSTAQQEIIERIARETIGQMEMSW